MVQFVFKFYIIINSIFSKNYIILVLNNDNIKKKQFLNNIFFYNTIDISLEIFEKTCKHDNNSIPSYFSV